jgi:predicted alpha/beta hydrolase family esterase
MARVFLLHGAFGNPDENWFPWLKKELEGKDFSVSAPAFPTPDGQTLDNWLSAFAPYEKRMNRNSILVGHSLGAAFALRLLERAKKPIHAAFLVAGFAETLGNPKFDDINRSFIEPPFDWQEIRTNCNYFEILQSSNDPHVPFSAAQHLADNLEAGITVIQNAGHFNSESGFRTFELLLEKIEKL